MSILTSATAIVDHVIYFVNHLQIDLTIFPAQMVAIVGDAPTGKGITITGLASVRLWNFLVVGPKKQDFWPKINILEGNHYILIE